VGSGRAFQRQTRSHTASGRETDEITHGESPGEVGDAGNFLGSRIAVVSVAGSVVGLGCRVGGVVGSRV